MLCSLPAALASVGIADWGDTSRSCTLQVIRILVVFGVGAIMGDGVLTPAISVVSAMEGLQVKFPEVTRGEPPCCWLTPAGWCHQPKRPAAEHSKWRLPSFCTWCVEICSLSSGSGRPSHAADTDHHL